MSFDPLHKWLGIPPDEQPPHHYRLLGVAKFEDDPDVINSAADKQMSFLHDLTSGENASAAEKLSNQVSRARLCLLDAKKKAAYDQSIALGESQSPVDQQSPVEKQSPVDQQSPVYVRSPGDGQSDANDLVRDVSTPAEPMDIPVRVRPASNRRGAKPGLSLRMIASIAGIVILLLLFFAFREGQLRVDFERIFATTIDELTPDNQTPPTNPATNDPGPPDVPMEPSSAAPPESPTPLESNAAVRASATADTAKQSDNVATDDATKPPAMPVKPAPKPRRSLADLLHPNMKFGRSDSNERRSDQSEPDSPAIDRVPLPSEAELDQKMKLVRELYQGQYRDAKNSKKRIELARQMYRDGVQTDDDPVGRFALWRVAKDIFVGQGAWTDAIAIVDSLHSYYDDIDPWEMKLEALREGSVKVSRRGLNDLFDECIKLANQASSQHRYQSASDAATFLLEGFSDRLRVAQIEQAKTVRDNAASKGKRLRDFRVAVKSLANAQGDVDQDPKLNETVGNYLAFVKGDWDEAIHYLSNAETEALKNAAKLQLDHQVSKATTMQVADSWHSAAQSTPESDQRLALLRQALRFYETAISESEGLEKRKAEKLVADLKAELPKPEANEEPRSGSMFDANKETSGEIGARVYHSTNSRSDFAKRSGNKFNIGMGNRADGTGEAAVGVELRDVKKIDVTGSASHERMITVDNYSKTGFFIDYHTPGGYTKRVFLGLGLRPGREFGEFPAWGKGGSPEIITDIGRSDTYQIDLTRWAPPTWDGRSWVSLYMQNAGDGRSIEAELQW